MRNMFMKNKKILMIKRALFLQKRKNYINFVNSLSNVSPLKKEFDSIIPLNIYQTWHSKNLPIFMGLAVKKLRINNPDFNYFLFDDTDCREFIKNNFDSKVLNAYDSLIPGAYKADLWRYCILYKNGGIYLDIKYEPFNNIKFIHFTEKEHLVYDINNVDIYNAFMVCLPGNELLIKAINKIVENVEKKFYGNTSLEPTGPGLLSKIVTDNYIKNIDMKHKVINNDYNKRIIIYKGITILKSYNGYIQESSRYKKIEYYAKLWTDRNIYK